MIDLISNTPVNKFSRTSEVCVLNPLRDGRWTEFVEGHPSASIFHSVGWLESLRRTYGYEPIVFTTSRENEPLSNGIVVCRVRSWATASRLVSLPFSDHCEPLVENNGDLQLLMSSMKLEVEQGRCRYLEFRPMRGINSDISERMNFETDSGYRIHRLDLSRGLDEIYRRFHKSCVQRQIKRAIREGLHYEAGYSPELLVKFYKLLVKTRRRHKLPPQPMKWFRNLAVCLGESLTVRVASKDGRPIAAIMTIHAGDSAVYKYGCSDLAYKNLGGMSLLLWHAIQDAKAKGACYFDFGRSRASNNGLISYKEHWGAVGTTLRYYRYPAISEGIVPGWKKWLVQKTCVCLPDPLLEAFGTILYKHVG